MKYTHPIRHAFIVENAAAESMAPLLEKRSVAMLPFAGKPLIQFWCEHLSLIGVTHLKIFVRRYPEQVRTFVGEGERWGLSIDVITLPESLDSKESFRFVLPAIQEQSFIVSLDRFPAADLAAWLESETVIQIVENDMALESIADLSVVNEMMIRDIVDGKTVSKPGKRRLMTRKIASPRDFWQINMDVINADIPDPLPLGFEVESGLHLEVGVQIKPGFEFKSACRLGRHSLINSNVSLGSSVVIGADTIIDGESSINESVIFDHTYIGSHSELNRVIVDGPMIYHVDLEQATWIDDASIIGSTKTEPRRVSYSQRLAAILLLSVLVWPIVIFYLGRHIVNKTAIVENKLYLPAGRNLNGEVNFTELPVLSLDIEHVGWRKATWLVHVVKGDLALV
ncbi:MAG: NDP-sugar synthase, partial [Gammaproteobacteria bacterium]|nr:NDP-sugar synthase [Gammaproteobacteria bacterium]